MKRKFVVGVSELTRAQELKLIEYLRDQKVAWWHWIGGFWLVVDKKGSLQPKDIRDQVSKISKRARSIVIRVDGRTAWAGTGPNVGDKNMFTWIRETWNKDASMLETEDEE